MPNSGFTPVFTTRTEYVVSAAFSSWAFVDITTTKYMKKLFDSDGEPHHFRSKTEDLSINSRTHVQTAMEKLDDGQLAKIQKQWEKFRKEPLCHLSLLA